MRRASLCLLMHTWTSILISSLCSPLYQEGKSTLLMCILRASNTLAVSGSLKLCRLAMAAVNRVGGLAAGIVSAIFVRFYQYVVDPAEAETWPFRLFSYLAKGVLRCDHIATGHPGTTSTPAKSPMKPLIAAHTTMNILHCCSQGRQ